jgi:hypothetical protein
MTPPWSGEEGRTDSPVSGTAFSKLYYGSIEVRLMFLNFETAQDIESLPCKFPQTMTKLCGFAMKALGKHCEILCNFKIQKYIMVVSSHKIHARHCGFLSKSLTSFSSGLTPIT